MTRFRVVLCAVVVLFFCRVVPAQIIEVNEKATRLLLREGGNQVIFPVWNHSSETAQADLRIEVLDSTGKIQGKTEKQETLSPGANRIAVPFSFWSDQAAAQNRETLWDRLRYTFEF